MTVWASWFLAYPVDEKLPNRVFGLSKDNWTMNAALTILLAFAAPGLTQNPVHLGYAALAPQEKQQQGTNPPPTAPPAQPPKPATEQPPKPATEQPATPKATPALDLQELLKQKPNEMRMVVTRYEADRGSLNRSYVIASSPTRHARFTKFHADWLKALAALDVTKLTEPARADLKRLQETVQKEQRDLEGQIKAQAEIATLLPFAPAMIELEERRRRMEVLQAEKAAGSLTQLKEQIDDARKAVEAGKDPRGCAPPTKALAGRAAETATALRSALRGWYMFYDGYDPAFSWWMSAPYKDFEKALQEYITVLKTKVSNTEAADSNGPGGPEVKLATAVVKFIGNPNMESDAPDLRTLLAFPQSEFRPVIQKYQADRGGMGRLSMMPAPIDVPRPPDRQARVKQFYNDWLSALHKLSFDSLSRDAQVDYLLLQNQIKHELRRAEMPGFGGGRGSRARSDGGIEGRPIGRTALLSELEYEMIPYAPEELIVIAEKEFAWCDAEIRRASRELGFGDDWKRAIEKAKTMHVEPGQQPEMIRGLAWEAIDYVRKHDLVTVPQIASETWRMQMMSPQRQLLNPFFTGGEVITVSFPTNTMSYEAKLQSLRGNNIPFSRATVHHELIPGHHLQGFMTPRYRGYRGGFNTAFWTEGWSLYWEMILYQRGFPKTAEDRVGFLFWRMHRCARIIFSLNYHLGKMSAQQCVDFLVERVGHERDNATAEVRRSFTGGYGALYQAAYMLGGLQIRELHRELVDSGKMTDRAFHDAVIQENHIPITMIRASLTKQMLTPDHPPAWKFYGEVAAPMTGAP